MPNCFFCAPVLYLRLHPPAAARSDQSPHFSRLRHVKPVSRDVRMGYSGNGGTECRGLGFH